MKVRVQRLQAIWIELEVDDNYDWSKHDFESMDWVDHDENDLDYTVFDLDSNVVHSC